MICCTAQCGRSGTLPPCSLRSTMLGHHAGWADGSPCTPSGPTVTDGISSCGLWWLKKPRLTPRVMREITAVIQCRPRTPSLWPLAGRGRPIQKGSRPDTSKFESKNRRNCPTQLGDAACTLAPYFFHVMYYMEYFQSNIAIFRWSATAAEF